MKKRRIFRPSIHHNALPTKRHSSLRQLGGRLLSPSIQVLLEFEVIWSHTSLLVDQAIPALLFINIAELYQKSQGAYTQEYPTKNRKNITNFYSLVFVHVICYRKTRDYCREKEGAYGGVTYSGRSW